MDFEYSPVTLCTRIDSSLPSLNALSYFSFLFPIPFYPMTPDQKIHHLSELFPHLTENDLKYLSTTGEDINVLITRVLDNNYKPLILDIKDLASIKYNKTVYKKSLNYPEVFDLTYPADFSKINQLRARASNIHEEANVLHRKASLSKLTAVEYSSEADRLREEASVYDREAAILVMKQSVENKNHDPEYQSKNKRGYLIDLHGLYTKEAIGFMDDLYTVWKFEEINFVTGQKMRNKRMRPVVEQWFVSHGFEHFDIGALIRGRKVCK